MGTTGESGDGGREGQNRIKNITIVGGGTAGWLTALILGSLLNNFREGPPVAITLIESPNIPTVGVGESTVPGIPSIMRMLGIDEAELIRRCNVTFKMSVRFERWFCEQSGGYRTFHHPFNSPKPIGGVSAAYHFHRYQDDGPAATIAQRVLPNVSLAEGGFGPRGIKDGNYDRAVGYAYHLDAGLLAQFLQEVAIQRDITLIRDDVERVNLDDRGFIGSLTLTRGGDYPVEFVIDCTGFRSLILGQALQEPFIPLSSQLLNDRAIPVQLPHRNAKVIEASTRSTALSSGWTWRVPLFNRVGTGYVYSSSFISDDEARSEFLQHLRDSGDLPESAPDPDTRVVKMRVGHSRRSWVKNCIGIGLSSGFVEPLESTGIFLIDVAARWFVGHFPDKECSPALANRYNHLINTLYGEIRDFIQTHYLTSNRPEPFWKAARNVPLSETLEANLDLWQHRLPEAVDLRSNTLFTNWNYIFVLAQKDFFKGKTFPLEGSITPGPWRQFSRSLQEEVAHFKRTLPKHYDLLAAIRNEGSVPCVLAMPPRQSGRKL
jgi:tryptophan halogenase